jgi:hypothetical protein
MPSISRSLRRLRPIVEQSARVPSPGARRSRVAPERLLARLARELARERVEDGRPAVQVFFDFLAAFGITSGQAAALEPPPAAAELAGASVTHATPIPKDSYYAWLSVYGLLGEAPNADFCEVLYTSFKDRYGFDDGQLKWFHMHARLDRDHGAMLAHYFRHAAGELGDLAQVREQALAFAPLYQRIWDAFGAWR